MLFQFSLVEALSKRPEIPRVEMNSKRFRTWTVCINPAVSTLPESVVSVRLWVPLESTSLKPAVVAARSTWKTTPGKVADR